LRNLLNLRRAGVGFRTETGLQLSQRMEKMKCSNEVETPGPGLHVSRPSVSGYGGPAIAARNKAVVAALPAGQVRRPVGGLRTLRRAGVTRTATAQALTLLN
jgi:hypothetical protein